MGLILDSSVLIQAERRGDAVTQSLRALAAPAGDQEAAISAIALVEIAHGIHRASAPSIRERRELFIKELLADVPVYLPFQDLLIGATALHLGYSVMTVNMRHFRMIPNLVVKEI